MLDDDCGCTCPSDGRKDHCTVRTDLEGLDRMPPRLRGKWALGITPRNFTWFMKDKLAVCERPGGYGDNHRRVRRQEEIIWLRENGFGCLISIIPAPHNLHNYDELGPAVPAPAVHRHRRPGPVAAQLLRRAQRAARGEHQGGRAQRGRRRPADRHPRWLHPLERPGRRLVTGHHDHRADRRPPAGSLRSRGDPHGSRHLTDLPAGLPGPIG